MINQKLSLISEIFLTTKIAKETKVFKRQEFYHKGSKGTKVFEGQAFFYHIGT
jgi:hypothetical protein